MVSRWLAVAVAVLWLGLAAREEDGLQRADVIRAAVALLFPLALIWFPERLGGLTGYALRGGSFSAPTPAGCVAAAGWGLLIGLPLLVVLLA